MIKSQQKVLHSSSSSSFLFCFFDEDEMSMCGRVLLNHENVARYLAIAINNKLNETLCCRLRWGTISKLNLSVSWYTIFRGVIHKSDLGWDRRSCYNSVTMLRCVSTKETCIGRGVEITITFLKKAVGLKWKKQSNNKKNKKSRKYLIKVCQTYWRCMYLLKSVNLVQTPTIETTCDAFFKQVG